MSTYGLAIRNAAGRVVYDTSTVTWVVIDTVVTVPNVVVNKSYTGLLGFTKIRFHLQLLNSPPDNQEGYSPVVYVNISGDNASMYTAIPYGHAEAAVITVLVQ